MRVFEKIVKYWREEKPYRTAEQMLKCWGALVVVIFATFYYAQYYRSGLNFGGEGGTVGVLAMRLMEGQRPIADTFLGYNVLWFYPVTWLFHVTGPSYVALRIYFFAICTATGVLAFLITRRVTGSGWFSTLVALGPVLMPGMIFRNYMAFWPMLNMLMLLEAYVFEQPNARRRWLWIAGAGVTLGLTFLTRIDLGEFFLVIMLGLLGLYPPGKSGEFPARLRRSVGALTLTLALLLATHAPVYYDAVRRGYDREFTAQYTNWIGMIQYLAAQQLAKKEAPRPAPVTNAPAVAPLPAIGEVAPMPTKAVNKDIDTEDYLKKRGIGEFLKAKSFYDRAFVLITYLPLLVCAVVLPPCAILLLWALWKQDWTRRTEALAVLITFGSALTLLPQFFFFRPDTPHLSEFMAPFLVAMGCAVWVAWRWSGAGMIAILYAALMTVVCGVNAALYTYHTMPKESGGTIAANKKRNTELVAENGVRVWMRKQDRDETQKLCEVIKAHTKKGEWLICYPYAPTINFMTDRPSYEFNLYVDNSGDVSHFHEDTLKKIEKYKPAALIIDNRAVNQTEDSRFQNWAAETYAWIKANYAYAGTFRKQEVYLRPDLYTPQKP